MAHARPIRRLRAGAPRSRAPDILGGPAAILCFCRFHVSLPSIAEARQKREHIRQPRTKRLQRRGGKQAGTLAPCSLDGCKYGQFHFHEGTALEHLDLPGQRFLFFIVVFWFRGPSSPAANRPCRCRQATSQRPQRPAGKKQNTCISGSLTLTTKLKTALSSPGPQNVKRPARLGVAIGAMSVRQCGSKLRAQTAKPRDVDFCGTCPSLSTPTPLNVPQVFYNIICRYFVW